MSERDDDGGGFAEWASRTASPSLGEHFARTTVVRETRPEVMPQEPRRKRVVVESKACGRCGETKEIECFYRRTTAQDGHDYYCKTCRSIETALSRDRIRAGERRQRPPLTRAVAVDRLTRAEVQRGAEEFPPSINAEFPKPRTFGECESQALGTQTNPCPFVSCKHHLYLDVTRDGNILLLHPEREPWEIEHTCSLRVADDGEHTLEEVGAHMRITRERVRQVIDRVIVIARGRFSYLRGEVFAEPVDGGVWE